MPDKSKQLERQADGRWAQVPPSTVKVTPSSCPLPPSIFSSRPQGLKRVSPLPSLASSDSGGKMTGSANVKAARPLRHRNPRRRDLTLVIQSEPAPAVIAAIPRPSLRVPSSVPDRRTHPSIP
jgi:hypothetical protein